MLLTVLSIVGVLVILYFLFVNFYPSFGGDVSKELQKKYTVSNNYEDGRFVNKDHVRQDMSFSETIQVARKFFFSRVKNGRPEKSLSVHKVDSTSLSNYKGDTRLIWFGHSAFLLQTAGKTILIDPMLSDVPAPHPLLGGNRFNEELPLAIEKLPRIDAVLISHDHYDHLDHTTIKKIKDRVDHFYVPLGVGVHLEAWHVERDKITEMDWWEETHLEFIQLVCTPAQHFSGRKFNNGQSTLWASWVLKLPSEAIYFSGDSGYNEHFKAIGDKYGPFDFAMMECGQYNELWSDIHMMPEETAQAGVDLNAKAIMPIHWGTFKLAMHSWTDPIERVAVKASELKIPLVTPQIGEPIILSMLPEPNDNWWEY